jgi:hypothetical protein
LTIVVDLPVLILGKFPGLQTDDWTHAAPRSDRGQIYLYVASGIMDA